MNWVREEIKIVTKIHNNYKKMVITLDKHLTMNMIGIQSIDVVNALLNKIMKGNMAVASTIAVGAFDIN